MERSVAVMVPRKTSISPRVKLGTCSAPHPLSPGKKKAPPMYLFSLGASIKDYIAIFVGFLGTVDNGIFKHR